MIPLFDLDSTLLKGGNRAHRNSFAHAFRTVYGIEARVNEIVTAGMIDNGIIVEILGQHGVAVHDIHAHLTEAAQAMLAYFLEHEDEGEYLPLAGVEEFLIDLRARDIPIGLLTGNVGGIGWRKCEKAGIRHFLDFGAFGNEALRRSDLVPIAKERARGLCPAAENFVIVGDTPRDIACAKEARIHSIGVATGRYSKEELIAAGADAAIATFAFKQYKEYAQILHFFASIA